MVGSRERRWEMTTEEMSETKAESAPSTYTKSG